MTPRMCSMEMVILRREEVSEVMNIGAEVQR